HPDREIERDGSQAELPERHRVEARTRAEIEDGEALSEPLRESLVPERDGGPVVRLLEEPRADLVVGRAVPRDVLAGHAYFPRTSPHAQSSHGSSASMSLRSMVAPPQMRSPGGASR